MENFSENTRVLKVKSSESKICQKTSTRVCKKALTKKLHQHFINTHTLRKILREGQISRSIGGKSHLSVKNFLWRYNNKEKGRCIR